MEFDCGCIYENGSELQVKACSVQHSGVYFGVVQELNDLRRRIIDLKQSCHHERTSRIAIEKERSELLEALRNIVGLFGEASTRLVMGKRFTPLHDEAVKGAKDVLEKFHDL